MSGMSRNKGKAGERELAALLTSITGQTIKRRVRQHDGDDDLMGLEGWSIECKRYATAKPAQIAGWWAQAVNQASVSQLTPVLFYRANSRPWRAVWLPACTAQTSYQFTIEADPLAWWLMEGTQLNGQVPEPIKGSQDAQEREV